MMRRYLSVIGAILVGVLGLAVWLKPPLEKMRAGVEAGVSEYARTKLNPGEALGEVKQVASNDWLIAVSHVAKVGDLTFYCVGALRVTFCSSPD